MEPDIDAICEVHYGKFLDKCSNYELRNLVYETFAARIEDEEEEEVYQRAFDCMYAWDAEYFISHPLHAIVDYALTREMRKDHV